MRSYMPLKLLPFKHQYGSGQLATISLWSCFILINLSCFDHVTVFVYRVYYILHEFIFEHLRFPCSSIAPWNESRPRYRKSLVRDSRITLKVRFFNCNNYSYTFISFSNHSFLSHCYFSDQIWSLVFIRSIIHILMCVLSLHDCCG